MGFRPLALFLILLLLVPTAALPISAYPGYVGNSITAYLLAVNEDGRGVAIPITIGLVPGNGDIIVRKGGLGNDTINTLKISAIYAGMISGVWYGGYDYMVWVEGKVSGPSAALLFTLMLALAFRGYSGALNFSATGIVGPGGIVGRVSGLTEKLNAARSVGLKKVIAPFDATTTDNFSSSVYTIYNALELVTGEPVCNISEATGYEFVDDVMRGAYANYTREVGELLKALNGTDISGIMKRLGDAEEAYNMGRYYAAATMAFQAYMQAVYAYLSSLDEGRRLAAVDALSAELGNRSRALEDTLMNLTGEVAGNHVNIYTIDLLYNVYYRLNDALSRFEMAKTVNDTNEADILLAYSIARLRTAEVWSEIARRALEARAAGSWHLFALEELNERSKALRTAIGAYIDQMKYILKDGPGFTEIEVYPGVRIEGPLGDLLEYLYVWAKLSETYYGLFSASFPNMSSAAAAEAVLATFSCISEVPGGSTPLSLITLRELLTHVLERSSNLTGWETTLYSHFALAAAYRLIAMGQPTPPAISPALPGPSGAPPIYMFIILALLPAIVAAILAIVLIRGDRATAPLNEIEEGPPSGFARPLP